MKTLKLLNKGLIIGFFSLFLFTLSSQAQKISNFHPKRIFWLTDSDTLSLLKAKKGVKTRSLSLAIVIPEKILQGAKNQELKFQFKWYMRGSTRMYATNNQIKTVKYDPSKKEQLVISSRGKMKKGWWKVDVIALSDKKMVSFKKQKSFWIRIK